MTVLSANLFAPKIGRTNMFFPSQHYHLPRSPLPKTPAKMRAELNLLSSQMVKLEREQQVQLARIAQIQQELDEIKRLLKKVIAQ